MLVSPNFFLNPQNVNYSVAVQTPIERITSVDDLLGTAVVGMAAGPRTPAALPAAPVMRLGDMATVYPRSNWIGEPPHRAARA